LISALKEGKWTRTHLRTLDAPREVMEGKKFVDLLPGGKGKSAEYVNDRGKSKERKISSDRPSRIRLERERTLGRKGRREKLEPEWSSFGKEKKKKKGR